MTHNEKIRNLPDGVLMVFEGKAVLLWRGNLHTWSHHGYAEQCPINTSSTVVQVLTPESVVSVFREGIDVQVHESARG